MSKITVLPDGSAYFVMTVGGPRPSGFINVLKYTKRAQARRWLFVWRMYCFAREGAPGAFAPMSPIRSLIAALRCP